MPTVDPGVALLETVLSLCRTGPREVLVVTDVRSYPTVGDLLANSSRLKSFHNTNVVLLNVARPSKRQQMVLGIQRAQGSLIVFADDDVIWPPELLQHVLACFENEQVGGVGCLQSPQSGRHTQANIWTDLEMLRVSQRMIQISANFAFDGSVTCLSGRTAAYRAEILKANDFVRAFTKDFWCGRYLLDSGDDVFITQWVLSTGWKLALQTSPAATIRMTCTSTSRHLLQLLRWARNSKRGQIRALFFHSWVWKYVW